MNDVDMPLPEPVACQWIQHGKVVNAFTHPPGDRSKWDYDGYWAKKGYDKAPLFTADQLHALNAQWRAIVAAEVAKERERCAAMFDDSPNAEMFRQDIAAAIRAGSAGS